MLSVLVVLLLVSDVALWVVVADLRAADRRIGESLERALQEVARHLFRAPKT